MRVVIVTAYFQPEFSSVTHLYADLAADLQRQGADVTVVTNTANRGLTDAQFAEYLSRRDETTPDGYRVLRVGPKKREKAGFLARGLHLMAGTLALFRAARRIHADAYVLGSMPPFLGLVGARLQKTAPTVYIVQDVFPDSMLLMGKYREGHPLVRACRRMEQRTYAGNTRFVTISEDIRRTLIRRGVDAGRIDVIENWADTDAIRPVARAENPLFDAYGLSRDGFYAVYAGTLGPLQNPDVLLDAARLLTHVPEITILILGGGTLLAHIERRMAAEQPANVRLLPLQPVERVSEAYSLGDVCLVPLVGGATQIAMPSKTWSAMAAGRPVILSAPPESAWGATLRQADCGRLCLPGSAASLAEAILALYENRDALPQMGLRAREYVSARLARLTQTRRYFEVLSRLVSQSQHHAKDGR